MDLFMPRHLLGFLAGSLNQLGNSRLPQFQSASTPYLSTTSSLSIKGLSKSVRLIGLVFALFTILPSVSLGDEVVPPKSPVESIEQISSDHGQAERSVLTPGSTPYRLIKFTGKFHLLVLHFPIAFLLAASLVQWYRVLRRRGGDAVPMLLWFGAVGASAAAVLGWMYAYDSVYFGDDEKILFWHRWLGTATAVVSIIVLLLRSKLGPTALALLLTLCAGLVAAAAHFGGSLVNGADFLKKF